MEHEGTTTVCGIDPGLTNMATWIGVYRPQTATIRTLLLSKKQCGAPLDSEDSEGAKKQSVQAASADSALEIADACLRDGVESVVVETAPQWNVPIRISAATIYGVLRGKGVPGIKFSSCCTKSKAIEFFAEQFKLAEELEKPPEGVDKRDKKVSAKIRLINKRNAVKVAAELLRRSEDVEGLKAFNSDMKKQDDMSDAILLGCGLALCMQKEREKLAKRGQRAKKKK